MELAIGLFSSLAAGGATAAAGAGAAAAGAGAAGILGGGSLLTSLLSGTVGVLGAIGAAREGEARSDALRAQSEDARFDAKQEELQGLQRADKIRRDLLAEKGERDVAAAASGLDLSFGTPAIARGQADDEAARALGIDADTTTMRAARFRERASSYSQQAREARSAGQMRAFTSLAEGGLRMARRG